MSAVRARLNSPNLGPVEFTTDARVPGETMINMAGVLEMAERAGTPQARLFLDAFAIAYERVANLPMRDGAKQVAALEEALKVTDLGSPVWLDPVPEMVGRTNG